MLHPTCAPARPPNAPPAGESPLHGAEDHLAVLSKQATAELGALSEVYRAAACVHDLLLQARGSRRDESHVRHLEVKALVALVNSEFERRMQTAKATMALLATERVPAQSI